MTYMNGRRTDVFVELVNKSNGIANEFQKVDIQWCRQDNMQ